MGPGHEAGVAHQGPRDRNGALPAVCGWLVRRGSPPVRYRTLRDLLGRPAGDPDLEAARREALSYGPARDAASRQLEDGTWSGRLHTGDSRAGLRVTTEVQFPRLVEYGWSLGDGGVMDRTASRLAAILGEVDAAAFLDLSRYMTGPRRSNYVRWFGRSIAAGLLAHAGAVGSDGATAAASDGAAGGGLAPKSLGDLAAKVFGVAEALLDAAYRFVTGPAAANPVEVRRGGGLPLVRPEAYDAETGYPAIPDLYLLQLFAYTQSLTRMLVPAASPAVSAAAGTTTAPATGPATAPTVDEARARKLSAVLGYIFGPAYAALDPGIGLVSLGEGRPFVKGWKIRLPGPEELAARGEWAYGLCVLEWFARLGAAAEYPATRAWLEWLDHHQDPERPGVYDLPAEVFKPGGLYAERIRLAPEWRSPDQRRADVTFRVQLVLAHLGRQRA